MVLIIICIVFGMLKIKRKRARSGRFDINEPSPASNHACYEGVTRIAGNEATSNAMMYVEIIESQSNDCSKSKDKSRSGHSTVPAAIIEKRARSEKFDLKINEPSLYSNTSYQISKSHKYRGVTRINQKQ